MKSSIQTDNSYKKLYSSQRLQNISLSSNQLASNSTFLKSFKSNAVKREFTQINYLMFYSSGSGSLNGSMNGSMSSSINGSINGGGQAAGQQRKSHLATCSSTRISIYNTTQSPLSTTTHQNTTTASSSSKSSSSASLKSAISAPVKSITRFGDVVTCCHVDDGAGLLVAGDQAGIVKVFDLASRAILRTFDGHKGPIGSVKFMHQPVSSTLKQRQKQIVSCSDDHAIRLWDLSGGGGVGVGQDGCIAEFKEHEDYVRSIALSPGNPNFILSGSYDHTVKLWDKTSSVSLLTLDHGAPVEDVVFLPGAGHLIASCGGNTIKIWDISKGIDSTVASSDEEGEEKEEEESLRMQEQDESSSIIDYTAPATTTATTTNKEGRLVALLSPHQKTITCLGVVVLDATASHPASTFLVSGSLDHQVKLIDLSCFKIVGGWKYPAPVMTLAMSPDNETFAVGLSNGLLSTRQRSRPKPSPLESKAARGGTFSHFNRHVSVIPDTFNNVLITSHRAQSLKPVDKYLRGFRYSDALDCVLDRHSGTYSHKVVHALLSELVARNALALALSNRDEHSLLPVLRYLSTTTVISNPDTRSTHMAVVEVLLDMYGPVLRRSIVLEGSVKKLKYGLDKEIESVGRIGWVCAGLKMCMVQSSMA